MAGHSHWAGIKYKKALVDSKRSKLWSKLSKTIIVAAKLGGGDPDANIRLRTAILEAKSLSMPKDNIERAIKRGTGELDGGNVEEIIYEGYGPGGLAVMCDIMTDNRNRTAPEIRKIFDVHGGSLGATGCVAYLFDRKGLILISTSDLPSGVTEETVMEIAMENDAQDVQILGDRIEITTAPELLSQAAVGIENASIPMELNQVTRIPQMKVEVAEENIEICLKLLETLEDHDDVQNVSTNLDFNFPPVANAISRS